MTNYQEEAYKFANFGSNPAYAYAGLAEEAGEVLGKYAKFIRKHDGIDPHHAEKSFPKAFAEDLAKYKEDLEKELGDVMWMVAAIATINNLDLKGIMRKNLDKLTDRLNRGVIIGEGDNR
jgi:NTP pyrophosphatase (non-canonical NTP hydrolase)